MREALASRSDRDFHEAPRRSRARAIAVQHEETMGDRLIGFVRTYPLEMAVTALLTAAGGAITWNALAMQTGRHPAPFFVRGGKIDGPAPLPPVRPLADALQPAATAAAPPTVSVPTAPSVAPAPLAQRSSSRDGIGELIRSSEPPPLPVARPAAPHARAPQQTAALPTPSQAQPAKSSIGDLIRFADAPPIPPALVGKVEPSRLVASGQRALAKLGYGIMKADGVLGPSTRQAIERFERDRQLPVTGDFSPRTVRELAAASGLPVE